MLWIQARKFALTSDWTKKVERKWKKKDVGWRDIEPVESQLWGIKYNGQEKNVGVVKRIGKQKTVKVIQNENHRFLNKKLIGKIVIRNTAEIWTKPQLIYPNFAQAD